MGNGVSQKEDQLVEECGQTTQFHHVLAKPEYSVPDLVHTCESEYIDKEQQKTEKELDECAFQGDYVHQTHQLVDDNTKPDQGLNDGAASIEECQSCSTETADTDRAIDLSLRNPDSILLTNLDKESSEISSDKAGEHDDAEATETEHIYATGTHQNILSAQKEFYPDNQRVKIIKTVDQEQILNSDNAKNVHLHVDVINELPNAVEVDLSFSKNEQEDNAVTSTENRTFQEEKNCSKCPSNCMYNFERERSAKECFKGKDLTENQDSLKNKPSKGKFFSKIFKFSKRKHNKNPQFTPEKIDIKWSSTTDASQIVEGNDVTEITNECFDETEVLVTRLNSLDSGISVDKSLENQVIPTTHADVHLHPNNTKTDQNDDIPIYNLEENLEGINDTKIKEDHYINNDISTKDFECRNESDIELHEHVNLIQPILQTAILPHSCMKNSSGEHRKKTLEEKMSNISSDFGTNIEIKENADSIRNSVKYKIKKKSWSLQSGGKKKKSDNQENDYSLVNADVSRLESKKQKGRLRKFSFRRKIDEKYVSTPNLKNTEIPEEGETINFTEKQMDEKKPKLKKIKKSTKTKYNKACDSPKLEKRSASLLDFILGNNAPRSNYSIVREDDIHITNSDAFEGVELSDLSLAGDEEVSASLEQFEEQKSDGIKSQEDQEHRNQNFNNNSNIDKFKLESLFTNMPNQSSDILHTQEVEACESLEFEDSTCAIISCVNTNEKVEYPHIVKPILAYEVIENRVKSANLLDQAEAKDIQNERIPQETLFSNETLNAESEGNKAEILNNEEHLDVRALPANKNERQQGTGGKEQGNLQDENETNVNFQHNHNDCRHALGMETNLPNKSFATMNVDDKIGVSKIDDITYNKKDTDDHVNAVNEHIPNITFLEHNVKPKSEFKEHHKIVKTVNKEIALAADLRSKISSRKVVIMKEVGVQAPDIYIPLDIEYFNKVACVSIGVQVTADELENEHVSLDSNNSNIIEVNIAPAYF